MPYACVPKIPINPGKLSLNTELMKPVVEHSKGRDTEPGCQAYFFFVPRDGNEEYLYGMEIYDDEKAIKETHFNSAEFQNFAKEGQRQGVSPGPPEINFGPVLGGWMTRPNEPPRTADQIILFSKMTAKPGQRADLCKLLTGGLKKIETDEPGTLSIVLVEDENKPDVCYVMERFKDQEAVDAHMKGSAAVRDQFASYIQERESIFAKAVAGFVSKHE